MKNKITKTKIISGYLLLCILGIGTIFFLYKQIGKAYQKDNTLELNNKQLIDLSNAINKLYLAETYDKNSKHINSNERFSEYSKLIDEAIEKMELLKQEGNLLKDIRLDSISLLLNQKKIHFYKIQQLNIQYSSESSFTNLKKKLKKTRDSLRQSAQQIKPTSYTAKELNRYLSYVIDDRKILDSLNKIQVSDTEILNYSDKVISNLLFKEDKLRRELQSRELQLQSQNRVLSAKIQMIINTIENELNQQNFVLFKQKQQNLQKITEIMFWVGILAILVTLFFGWIILKDLSKQQKYRDTLEKLNLINSNLLKSKTMLMATVNHDMQSPLNSILGFSKLIKDTNLDTEQKMYIENLIASGDYLQNLVNDLNDFSKLERNNLKINLSSFMTDELVLSIFNTHRKTAIDKGILLLYDIDSNLNQKVISDPQRVKQILTNLVTNAIKFTQKGYVKITVQLLDDNIIFAVEDSGIGIATDAQQLIFDEFTQANDSIEQQFGGTGLGLNISKRLAHLLDGKIWVESTLGKGSIFYLQIPYIEDNQTETNTLNKSYLYIDNKKLKDKKILYVDDDNQQLILMELFLKDCPFLFTTLNNPNEVIAVLEKEKYDLLFTDIQMPQKSGFVLIEEIRNHHSLKNIPVVALSGKKDLDTDFFKSKGFTDSLEKPTDKFKIIEVITKLLDFEMNMEQHKKNETSDSDNHKLFNLNQLKQFTFDDNQALISILNTFISSYTNYLDDLTHLSDKESVSSLAHKMIPMLKQVESYQLVPILETLENKNYNLDELPKYKENIIDFIQQLLTALKNEIELLKN
ncbi:MAG: ATP-binding protein [Bacteroidota bacterium]|nr:ATP-binding protein [Bacteroidota bacterium]